MIVKDRTELQEIGRAFAQELRDDRSVVRLWVREGGDHVELWLETAPIPRDHELLLYGIEAMLDKQFPGVHPEIHVIHKGLYESPDFVFEAPSGAERIPLR